MPGERIRELELLLCSLDDYYGASLYARAWSGYSRALAGPAPSARGTCRSCDGIARVIPSGRACIACRNGQALDSHPCVPCPDCAGKGFRYFDAYTEQPVAHEERKRTKQLARGAKARGHVVAAGLERDAGRWETARERADRNGSYAELRACLIALRDVDPVGEQLVRAVYVRGAGVSHLNAGQVACLNRAMLRLSVTMPKRLRLPQWCREQLASEPRRAQAVRMRREGASVAAIQRALGGSRFAVRRLLSQ